MRGHNAENATKAMTAHLRFRLTAFVTVTDAAGVSVHTETFEEAIKIIRTRLHAAHPVIALDPLSTDSKHMTAGLWEVAPDSFILSSDTDRTPDYTLHYREFILTTGDGAEYTSSRVDELLQAVDGMAQHTNDSIHLDSDLLGVATTTFAPPPPKPTHAPTIALPVLPPKPTVPPTVGTRLSLRARATNLLRTLTGRAHSDS